LGRDRFRRSRRPISLVAKATHLPIRGKRGSARCEECKHWKPLQGNGHAVTSDQSKEEKHASSHEASHGKQEERGHDSQRRDLGGARIVFSTSKSPKRPPVYNVLHSCTEPGSAGIHYGHSDDEVLQTEHEEEGESADHDHYLKIPHSSAEASRRIHQSISDPEGQDPTQYDDAKDYRSLDCRWCKHKKTWLEEKSINC
jgi:hypothetical protein